MKRSRNGQRSGVYITEEMSYRAKRRARRRHRRMIRDRVIAAVLAAAVVGGVWFGIHKLVQHRKTAAEAPPAATETAQPKPEGKEAFFQNTAFIGNSFVTDLENMGLVSEADFFGRVGLNLDSVMELPARSGDIPAAEELCRKQYKRVFMVFGENELGWREPDVFVRKYSELINKVKASMPGVKIYVQAVTPVTAKASEEAKYGGTNENIVDMNGLIQRVARENQVYYADLHGAVVNEYGCLPDDVGGDGVHFNRKYCQIWVDYLRDTFAEEGGQQ